MAVTKKPVQISIDQGLLKKLDVWRSKQTPPAQRSATVEAALSQFLADQPPVRAVAATKRAPAKKSKAITKAKAKTRAKRAA